MRDLIDLMKPVVVGLVWSEDDETKYRLLESFVPPGRLSNYWYNPHASEEDVKAAANPDKLAALDANATPGAVLDYLNQIRTALEYPFYWDAIKVRLPLQEIFNAKIGSEGENLKNRVHFQILDTLLGLYGKLPGFSLIDMAAKVNQLYKLPVTASGYPTDLWLEQAQDIVDELDDKALLRNFKLRFNEKVHQFEADAEKQYLDAEAGEDNMLMDQACKQLCLLVPDVRGVDEAEFIKSQPNGILIGVDVDFPVDKGLFDICITVPEENAVTQIRRVIHEQMQRNT